MTILAVDCMGGDHGPRVTLPGCRLFLDAHPDASLLLVGQGEELQAFRHPRASVVPASEVVAMDDPVEVALRRKKDSSMRVAIRQVKDGNAQAAVSAGNTGALMALARYLLKTVDGIDRRPSPIRCRTPRVARPPCWTWGPTLTAPSSTCCSSRSWARRWSPRSSTRSRQASAC